MKTNFILNLKRYAFLVLAALGAFEGYSQSTQNPSIGGTKIPSTDPFGQILNIGGAQGTPRDTGGMMVLSQKTQCLFAYPNDIGGKGTGTSTDIGQFDDDDFDPYNIGGKNSTGGLGFFNVNDIGGRNTGGRGTPSDNGQFDDDTDPFDIGGRGGHTGTGTGEISSLSDTGGGKGTSAGTAQRTNPTDFGVDDTGGVVIGRPTYCLAYNYMSDIGGRNTSTGGDYDNDDSYDTGGRGNDLGTGMFENLTYIPGEGCIFDTGGRDLETGLLTNQNADIGGGKSSDTGLGLIAVADTGGRNGHGTSTTGDYRDDKDDDTGGKVSQGTTGEVPESYAYLSALN